MTIVTQRSIYPRALCTLVELRRLPQSRDSTDLGEEGLRAGPKGPLCNPHFFSSSRPTQPPGAGVHLKRW